MQNKNNSGRFYDYFPPYAGDPLDFTLMLRQINHSPIHAAWSDVFLAEGEFDEKINSQEGIQESDVERWQVIYDTYRKLVLEGLQDEYKQDFIDGKIV
jgi:hypothetical protein